MPQWNGVSERRNRTLLDMVRSMMSQTNLPLSFWGYAPKTAAFTLNRIPSKFVEKTPYEIWTGKSPRVVKLTSSVCRSTNFILSWTNATLWAILGKLNDIIFITERKQKCLLPRMVSFWRKSFSSKMKPVGTRCNSKRFEKHWRMSSVEHSVETPLAPRRSQRAHRAPDRYMFLTMGRHDVLLLDNDEPKTYKEAVMGPDSEKWLQATRSEMKSMADNQVWNLVEPLDEVRPIEYKWVFKKKIDARVVAKRFRQIQGVDYDETFLPVAMIKYIRILLAVAAYHNYEVWQMDVKMALLNGNLSEDVYTTQPEGFVNPQNAGKVCKLLKSIYGLKQASRSWNLRFDEVVKGFGFIKNVEEPCAYKKVSGSALVFLVLYVDDILLIGNGIPMLEPMKDSLRKSFSMKDLGEAAYVLGIKIYRDRSKCLIGLCQSTYIDKVLKRFNMNDSKKGFLPMSPQS
ncbi:hypothetical protein U9M48_003980 [Paspalum notatum var. saurae]|uniref:Integrase catalytic domain-containing protein n=1 Tax=Paspalum notatum var. saurae TaxID=547442 RepID=A0AAQ3PM03_PASNO